MGAVSENIYLKTNSLGKYHQSSSSVTLRTRYLGRTQKRRRSDRVWVLSDNNNLVAVGEHRDESETDGYEKDARGRIIRRADEQAIGRRHYLRLNGNRQSNPDDGYNFRGRGLIQVTGYEKYHGFMEEYNDYWQGNPPDTVSESEVINIMPYAIRSAIWFWLHYEVYSRDQGHGYDDVASVTKRVNGGSMGLAERQTAYKLCEEVFL